MAMCQRVMGAVLMLSVWSVAAHAQTTSTTVTVNGAQLYVTSTGRGTPMLLIHGYPLNGDLFEVQRAELSSLFQVITVDLRGFGRSTAPDSQGSIELYAQDVLGVMDALGIRQAVIGGHSMGGMITLEMYRREPERFLAMLLISTNAMPAPVAERMQFLGVAQQAQQQGVESLLPVLLPQFLTGATRASQPDVVQATATLIRQASLNGFIGGANALANRPDLRPVLPTIAVPTLIMWGQEDSIYGFEIAQMLDAAIPNSQAVIIPLAQHGMIRERASQADAFILAAARAVGLR